MRRLRAGVTLLYSRTTNYYLLYLKYVDGETTNHICTIYSDSFKLFTPFNPRFSLIETMCHCQ